MVGTTLTEIRDHVDELAATDGRYVVHCGQTGERPIPIDGKRFESRLHAERAAVAASQYRAELRRYDPRLPRYDLVVSEAVAAGGTGGRWSSATDAGSGQLSSHASEAIRTHRTDASLVEFCHRVAAGVFESLCRSGNRDVETAVMDDYLDLAETVGDPDELCLCLLESMAVELDHRLSAAAAADVLADAATRLPTDDSGLDSLTATLETLDQRGLLSDYSCHPDTVGPDDASQSTVVRIAGYALSPRDGRLPVLPVVLCLHRHGSGRPLSALRAVDDGDCWELTLVRSGPGDRTDVASVPVERGT